MINVCLCVSYVCVCVCGVFVFLHWHPIQCSRTLFLLFGVCCFGGAWKYIFSHYISYHSSWIGAIGNICVCLTHDSQPFASVSFIMGVGREAAATTTNKRYPQKITILCACVLCAWVFFLGLFSFLSVEDSVFGSALSISLGNNVLFLLLQRGNFESRFHTTLQW